MSEANFLTKALTDTVLTRRSFLKWSAALGGTAALAGGLNYGLSLAEKSAQDSGITIVPTGCSHNCGGRCVLKAWVKDGTIVRITTDDRPDSFEDPQLRACVRGRAYRRRVYHPDRLKYPMKRVGERGEGKFEKISWDEATETVAKELRRVIDTYGNASIVNHYAWGGNNQFHGFFTSARLLNLLGGFLTESEDYSAACWEYAMPNMLGSFICGNSRDDLRNSRLIWLWGFNPAEMIFGTNTHYFIKEARKAGARVVCLDPRLSLSAVGLADEWIPILPGTDAAFGEAVAYVLITENLVDQAFCDTYVNGYDEEHLPAGVPAGNSFKSYILGQSDGVPKTPEYAEAITGVPKETIVRLARELGGTHPAAILQGWGGQRRAYGEQFVRFGIGLAAITGNVGIPGAWPGSIGTARGVPVGGMPVGENKVPYSIPVYLWTDAVLRGTEMGPEDGVRLPGGYTGVVNAAGEPVEGKLPSNIKLIYNNAGNALLNQHANCNRTAEILKDTSKVEFIVVHEHFMTPSAKFADILLPASTFLESFGLTTTWLTGDSVIFMNKAIEPLYGTMSDYQICAMVADKLGIKDQYTEGKTEEDWLREWIAVSQQADPNFPSYEELKKVGVYVFKYDQPSIAFADFRADPVAHPLATGSGKIELFSKDLYDRNDPEIPAIPKYIPEWEGPSDPLTAKYPLQMLSHHYVRRVHSIHDNVDWLEEVAPQRVYMNTLDAEARGIADGDTVLVYNDRGKVKIPARVTPGIMPDVVDIPQGGWYTPDANGVDIRGCPNTLTNHRPSPWAKGNSEGTTLVQVEKA